MSSAVNHSLQPGTRSGLHAFRAMVVFAAASAIAIPAHAQESAVPVGTVYAERKPVTNQRDFVGRVEAIDRVEIRARVKGFLDAVLFKEGDQIKKGDPLYRIEKGLFQASVEQAQGALERSKSAKVLTEIQLQRAQDLLAKSAGTVVARDQALAADQQAKGAILMDEANLATANINLGYTDIVSPISGKISKTNMTVGNVVGPDSGALTLIVSQDPMYVTFPVSQRELLPAQLNGPQIDVKNIKVTLRFSDGSVYDQTGSINFVDVSVDRSTDTLLARATMPNPAGALVDGQYVRVAVEVGAPDEKIVIPQSALIADQEGLYVFVVESGKAAVKRVRAGREDGANVVIDSGLDGGEQVIVDGIQGIRPGLPVLAAPASSNLNRS